MTVYISFYISVVGIFSLYTPIDEEENEIQELSKIAEKQDPEFFKYLQENDPELLNFDSKAIRDDVQSENGDGDDPMEEDVQTPVLTKEHLRTWQRALLEVCNINKHIRFHTGVLFLI